MSQESLAIVSYFVGKLFEWKYNLFNQLSNTIYKRGTKYIIKQSNLIRGSEIINDAVATYNDKFKLSYVIDEIDPRLIIKIDITDIDGLIKSYDPNPKKIIKSASHGTQKNTSSVHMHNNNKQIKFINY
jgi:hypothetical protein